MKEGTKAVEGMLLDRRGLRPGYMVSGPDGVRVGTGSCPEEPDARGIILTDVVNGHTHCADYGLRVPEGMSLEELVAPPDGLKHRYLREASDEELSESMGRFGRDSRASGASAFVDFREGGAAGCRLLRASVPDAVILGRPVSPEFDPQEIEDILSVADGIGISSVSDMDPHYIEQVADMVRDERRIFAIHVSERVREDIDLVLSLDPAFVVHMCEATDSDIVKCAEAEVPIVVCPTSNAYFGKVPPIARAEALGADLAIGTDNGMLRSPDIVDEASRFVAAACSQGCEPDCVWKALTCLSGKILNQQKIIPEQIGAGCPRVLYTDDFGVMSAFGIQSSAVRVDNE